MDIVMSLNELARLMHGGDCFVSEYGRLKGDLSPKSKLYFGLFAVVKFRGVMHRRRSGWTSGGRMASAEGGSMSSGIANGEGCPSPAD